MTKMLGRNISEQQTRAMFDVFMISVKIHPTPLSKPTVRNGDLLYDDL